MLPPFAAQLSTTTAPDAAPAPEDSVGSDSATGREHGRRRRRERAPAVPAGPAPPTHGEVAIALPFAGGGTDWSGDAVGYAGFTLGLRLFRFLTPYVGASLGYGRVDERLLTRLTVGIELGIPINDRFRPYIFGAFVHQHEESLASVAELPAGAVLGIGAGIRHRVGGHFGLGLAISMVHRPTWDFTVAPELSAMSLTYSSGPSWYYLGGVTVALHFRLF